MGKKISKNLAKVSSMLDGTFGGHKTVVGQYNPVDQKREIGERWTDSDGKEWEQKDGYRASIKTTPSVGLFSKQCKDCKTNCSLEKRHLKMFNKFSRCFYCQINFEAELKSKPIRWFAWARLQELNKMEMLDREFEAMIYELHETDKTLFDKSVANALANSEIDTTMKINKKLVN